MALERGPTKGMLTICSQQEPAITGCGELVCCTHARIPALSLDSQDQTFRDAPLVHCTGYRRNWAAPSLTDRPALPQSIRFIVLLALHSTHGILAQAVSGTDL
jgi:hypothetical protein